MRPRFLLWLLLCVVFALVLQSRRAMGHDLQPALLELKQTDAAHISVLWKVPARTDAQRSLQPRFPSDFRILSGPETITTADATLQRWSVEAPRGLDGATIEIAGLSTTLADVMVRVVRVDGTASVTRLNPAMTSFTISGRADFWQTAATFTRLGIEHILMGVDHLLFVLGLVLVVKKRWMLLKTITAFTIAHSLTLGIATLGYASAPVPPLNAAIALSILFLGPEMVRARRGQSSFTIEHPWVVAFAFGLLHGFGFASGLTSLGLTHGEIPLALLLFNVGVEIGQLLFVFVILGLIRSFRILEIHWPQWVQWVPAYCVGGLGAFWTIQRVVMMLGVSV